MKKKCVIFFDVTCSKIPKHGIFGKIIEKVLKKYLGWRDEKPNFLKNRAKVRFTGWTKLGWNYFIVTYHRVKNSKYVIYRYLKTFEKQILNNFEDPLPIPQPTIGLNNA